MDTEFDLLRAALDGRYDPRRELGHGAMATVYLARDHKHDRDVAIKVFRADFGASIGSDRFLSEIRVTAKLQHPHILPLLDSGEAAGLLYYVMPYVTGETLQARLERDGRLPVDDALAIARAIASALDYAHRQGIVHRDVKPANVLLSDGVAVVADFGIARAMTEAGAERLTHAGLALGTPAYMSPEQASGEADVDGRADQYALGCVLYEALTGEPPFTGANAQAIIARHFTAPVPSARRIRAEVPVAVDVSVSRAMAKSPDERFASTTAFMSAMSAGSPEVPVVSSGFLAPDPGRRTRTSLVGRTQELAGLLARLDALAQGQGGLILLGGEPGIGKTRLAEEVLAEARKRGFLTLTGHSIEMEGAPPYLPFLEQMEQAARVLPAAALREALGSAASEIARVAPALRQQFSDIPPATELPPDQRRHYLFGRFREFIQRAATMFPMVVLSDDLQWADDGTLLLLEHLAQDMSRLPILVVGTYRDADLDVARPFANALERFTHRHLADRISLKRLPATDVAELLARLGGVLPPDALVDAVVRGTEGNPFFVEEVFQHLKEEGRLFDVHGVWRTNLTIGELDVPEGVRLVLGRRLERVTAECRALLTSAAVVGPRFELAVVESLGEVTGEALLNALDEAEAAGLIVPADAGRVARYAFTHELIRATLLSALSLPRRQRRHLQVSEAIEKVHARKLEAAAADLAHHCYQAGNACAPERTFKFIVMAAQRGLASAAFDDALAQADRALSLGDELGERSKAEMLVIRALALRGLSRWQESIASYQEALTAFGGLGDRETVVRTAYDLGFVLGWVGAYEPARAIVDIGLAAAGDEPTEGRVRLLALGGFVAANEGHDEAGIAMIDEAERTGCLLADHAATLDARFLRGLVQFNRGAFRATNNSLMEVAREFRQMGDVWRAVDAETLRMTGQFLAGDSAPARNGLDALAAEAERVGHLGSILILDQLRGVRDFTASGDVGAYAACFATAHERWQPLGRTISDMARMHEAHAQFFRGHWDEAHDLLAEMTESSPLMMTWRDVFWALLFRVKALRHDADAMAVFGAHQQALPVHGRQAILGAWWGLYAVSEGFIALGERERCAALYPVALQMVEQGILLTEQGVAGTTAAITAAAGRQYDVAQRHFDDALRLADEMPHVLAKAETRRWYAWMLNDRRAPGDLEAARALLHGARTTFERMGMAKHLELCDALGREVERA